MQRRYLIIGLVFVVGFGVGYGITWLLVGSGGREAGDGERAARTGARADDDGEGRTDAARPSRQRGADTQAADVAPAGAHDAHATLEGDGVGAGVDGGRALGPPPDALDARGEEAPPATAGWQACHQRVCRVDFGRVSGGISIRKGRLEHRQDVDWDRDFARADKIGTLEAGSDVRVEVLAVGLTNGQPTAAYIVRKTRRDEVKGVIALRVGDKVLALVPVD
jgi:hypothetical protein